MGGAAKHKKEKHKKYLRMNQCSDYIFKNPLNMKNKHQSKENVNINYYDINN